MNILRKLFSSKKAVAVAAEQRPEVTELGAAAVSDIAKPEKRRKSRKKSSKSSGDPAALQRAREEDAARIAALAAAPAPPETSAPPASTAGGPGQSTKSDTSVSVKSHMGVSRSHKKILVDYQAARAKSTEVIGEAELEALNNAKSYFLDQNWDVAIDKLSAIIEAHPTWDEPWVLLMDCFFELKDWERCIELADELVYFHPDNVSAPCYQATALKELNRTKEAIYVCNKAIDMFPSSYFLLTIKGDCFFKEENYKLANESYSRALKIEKFIDGTQKAVSREVVPWARLKWRAQVSE